MKFQHVLALIGGFFLMALTGPASALDMHGVFKQGGMVTGRVDPGTKLFLDGAEVFVGPEGQFVFGFGRDAGPDSTLTVLYPSGIKDPISLKIEPQIYHIDKVDGVPQDTVVIPESEKVRRANEIQMVSTARAIRSSDLDWEGGFVPPAEGRISGVYGSQRILNGVPASPHFGLDITGDVGTPVHAPAGGTVVLAEKDFLLEGGIIIIDHGFKVSSTLMHLSKVGVKVGQIVKQGDVVGAIGVTGRASGLHVDWRINWGEVRLDPALVIPDTQKH